MSDKFLRLLNSQETLENAIPTFIEAFVEYYGEERRKEIEEKFSKAKFLGYQSLDGVNSTIIITCKNITEDLVKEILDKHNLPLEIKDLTNDSSFDTLNIHPILKAFEIIEDNELGIEGRLNQSIDKCLKDVRRFIPDFTREDLETISNTGIIPEKYDYVDDWLKNKILFYTNSNSIEKAHAESVKNSLEFFQKIDSDINNDNFREKLKDSKFLELLDLKEDYQKAYETYLERTEKIKKYVDEYNEYLKISGTIRDKSRQEFILDNLDLIPEDKRSGLEEYRKDYTKSWGLNSFFTEIFGYSYYGPLKVECFSSEKEEILNSTDKDSWKADCIKSDRIDYFRACGIDLGSNYEEYLNSEEAKKVWPSTERIDKLIEEKEKNEEKCEQEIFNNTRRYQETLKEINSFGWLDKHIPVDKDMYKNGGTFVSPNIIKTDNGYELLPLVAICCNSIKYGDIDHNIVHELNHLFELHLNGVYDNEYNVICGWDVIKSSLETNEETNDYDDNSKRSYELFNEIINELIAQDICELMHKNKMYVFDSENKSNYKNVTSYEHSLFLVRQFYNKYKDLIVKSRSNGNIDIILDAVGKDNFDELNGLFETYSENFSGFKIYNLMSSLSNKEDNEMTRVFYELNDKRDVILEKMDKYYEEHKEVEHQL